MYMTRLRVSGYNLVIESGRWHKPNKIPRNDRKYKRCNTLEDEFHFIIECSFYSNHRKQYIKKYYRNRPSIPTFIELLACENVKII